MRVMRLSAVGRARQVRRGTRTERALPLQRACAAALLIAAACAPAAHAQPPSAAPPRPLVLLADHSYPPMTYLEGGVAKGMDVDLARALAKRMDREIRIELTDWGEAQQRVLRGEADGLLGMSISAERRQRFDFSTPMFTREFGLLARSGDGTVRSLDDLEGRRVGVTPGGFPRHFLEARGHAPLTLVATYEDAFKELTAGRIDVIAADLWVAAYLIGKGDVRGVTIVGRPFARAPAAIAVRKGDAALLAGIDRTIRTMLADGSLAAIHDSWRPQEMLFVSRQRVRSAVTAAGGAVLALLVAGMAVWIASQRRSARRLRASEERLRAIIERTPNVAIQLYDARGRVLLWNRASQSMYGWSPAEATGKTLDQLIHTPEETARFVALLQEIAHTGQPHGPAEFHTRRRDGSDVYCLATVFAIPGTDADHTFVCMDVDLTDLKKADAALRESAARLRTLSDATFEGIAICEDGILVDANDQIVQILGYGSRQEMIGKPVVELVAPESRPLVQRMIESGHAEPYEHLAVRKDGSIFPVEVRGRTIAHTPHLVRITAVRDMTARKRAEAALRESERQRAAALQREQEALEHYARQLLASQESERRRIAGELHDSLGQNLLLIKNRAQLALTATDPAAAHAHLEHIRDASALAIAEVRQIAHALHPYQLDHLGLTHALESMIENAAQSTAVAFTRKLDKVDDAFDREAATNLYRVVQEWLNNVLKHARAAHVWITLERDVREVRLVIRDDGCGFVPEPQPRDTAGSGMGLQNITERVRILGGRLTIQAAPGSGATLEAVLPISADL